MGQDAVDLKDREVKVFFKELLRAGGLNEQLLEEFTQTARFELSVVGREIAEFVPMVEKTIFDLESRTSKMFRATTMWVAVDFYVPSEAQASETGKGDGGFGPAFDAVSKLGSVGLEISYRINFKQSMLTVNYNGLVERTREGFAYSEKERSIGGVFTKGPLSVAKMDALVVRFGRYGKPAGVA